MIRQLALKCLVFNLVLGLQLCACNVGGVSLVLDLDF